VLLGAFLATRLIGHTPRKNSRLAIFCATWRLPSATCGRKNAQGHAARYTTHGQRIGRRFGECAGVHGAAARGIDRNLLKAEQRGFTTQVHDTGECPHHGLEMAALDDGARDPSSGADLSVPQHAGRSDAAALRTHVRASARSRSFLALDRFLKAVQGLAFGEKKLMGRSRAVRKPAGASKITGMELTTTDRSRDIAGRAAGNNQSDVGMSPQFNGVCWIFCSHVHLQFEIDQFFSGG